MIVLIVWTFFLRWLGRSRRFGRFGRSYGNQALGNFWLPFESQVSHMSINFISSLLGREGCGSLVVNVLNNGSISLSSSSCQSLYMFVVFLDKTLKLLTQCLPLTRCCRWPCDGLPYHSGVLLLYSWNSQALSPLMLIIGSGASVWWAASLKHRLILPNFSRVKFIGKIFLFFFCQENSSALWTSWKGWSGLDNCTW